MTHRTYCRHFFILPALVAVMGSCAGSVYRECDTFAPVAKQVQSYASQHAGRNVLVVMDIDNTLLAMDRDLGSDQWFEWQEYLLKHDPTSPQLVGKTFGDLLDAQGLLFAAYHMHPPEAEQPQQVKRMQQLGVHTLVLTSRGDPFRAATLRELKRADYDFSESAPSINLFKRRGKQPYETGSRFLPYNLNTPAAFGLMAQETTLFDLPAKPRPVSYADGVMMTAGQHKGAMLLLFLHLTGKQYDAVVYVDDHQRHVTRVYDALSRRGIEVTTFHYKHEKTRVQKFAYGPKTHVTRQWQAIQSLLEGEADPSGENAVAVPHAAE